MRTKLEKRPAVGVMVYRTFVWSHAHNIDKPHSWSRNQFWSLWIGLGPYSLTLSFQ
jgi:hypothetical protein